MLFNSYVFIFLFAPLAMAGFFAVARWLGHRAAIAWVTACSLLFYSWWDVSNLPVILTSIGFNYFMGTLLGSAKSSRSRHALLVAGVVANLGALSYFKYWRFLVENGNLLLGTRWELPRVDLPLGISFFTFQQIAFLVDASRRASMGYGLLEYAMFVTLYPHLIAGPMVHHREIIPPFASGQADRPNLDRLALGASIFVAGLFKKVIIADSISGAANALFGAAQLGAQPGLLAAWVGALAYTFQIYFDFSGYSDMCVGLGRMFGITIPINFNSPYKSTNVAQFWRRWHMTLSRFLRDYLYVPLGGSRKGSLRRYFNLFVTMLLGGLWHGAAWTFVLWGALHGTVLAVTHWFSERYPGSLDHGRMRKAFAALCTFAFVVVTWVIFRASSLRAAGSVLRGMCGMNGLGLQEIGKYAATVPWLPVLAAAVWILPNTNEIFSKASRAADPDFDRILGRDAPSESRFAFRPSLVWAGALAVAFLLAVASSDRVEEFLYWQF